MVGILIVTHGKMGVELLKSAELIVGEQDNVEVMSLNHGDDIVEFGKNVANAIEKFSKDFEVLILTDLFGGSPSNVAGANMNNFKFKCLTGVNLPMLIEATILRSNDAFDLNYISAECMKSGIEGIRDLNEVFLNN